MLEIAKSPAKYVRWKKRAASGDRFSQLIVGMVHTRTEALGNNTDPDEGIRWLEAAARQGSVYSIKLLGNIYATDAILSQRVEHRPELERLSASWYEQGASLEDMDSERLLGDYLSRGKGVAKDEGKAVRTWLSAAEKGSRLAQLRLFTAYSEGVGVPVSLQESARWGILASREMSGVSIMDAPRVQRLEAIKLQLSDAERVVVEGQVAEWLLRNAALKDAQAVANERECGIREFNKGMVH